MASTNYYLKGAYSKERLKEIHDKKLLKEILQTPRQVFLMLSTKGERLQVYTKKRIPQMLWDFDKQEVDCRKDRKSGAKINKWFHLLKEEVFNSAIENELQGKRTTKAELEEILSKRILEKREGNKFDEQLEHFLKLRKTGDGNSLRINTVNKYRGVHKHLKAYSAQSGMILNVKYFDKEFLVSFKEYLTKILKLNDNTVAKEIKSVKAIIGFYMRKGVVKTYDLTEVKATMKEGEIYVLPIKFIVELQNMPLENQELRQSRDIFCFMCWTGQRYSDYEVINHSDFSTNEKGDKVWKLVTVKTNTAVTVPIVEYAEEILKSYKDSPTPLPRLSNQETNTYLKELGKLAGLNHSVKLVEYFDGQKKEKMVPFYEVLTTHVARKSYITNSLILGIPERVVKDVSGHKDEKSFRRYVHLAESYKSEMINKAFSMENISKHLMEQ